MSLKFQLFFLKKSIISFPIILKIYEGIDLLEIE
jgi:hypothetical protein